MMVQVGNSNTVVSPLTNTSNAIIRGVNTDGLADRVILARSTDLDLTGGDEELCLTGNLADRGQSFMTRVTS